MTVRTLHIDVGESGFLARVAAPVLAAVFEITCLYMTAAGGLPGVELTGRNSSKSATITPAEPLVLVLGAAFL